MKNILVVFGGRSSEHDVSIITGHQVIENADKSKYNTIPVYISKTGEWYTGSALNDVNFFKHFDSKQKGVNKAYISPVANDRKLYIEQDNEKKLFGKPRPKSVDIDAIFPAMHGMNGEDGTLQGLFELADIPYTCSSVLGSSVGMDKIAMKALFRGNDFPVLDFVYFDRNEWNEKSSEIIDKIENKLEYPVFVKPSNLGSSIGINKAKNRDDLKKDVEIASYYDRRIIVENGVEDIMEINCSALGFGNDIKVSLCEQPLSWKEFLTFDEKYLRNDSSKGMKSLDRKIPAPISDEMTKNIQNMSRDIFSALDCKGVVRIDYIIDKKVNKLYVNEINTIPGSIAFYLWEPLGISFQKLIDLCIGYAFKANDEKNKNVYAFDSSILNKFNAGAKTAK